MRLKTATQTDAYQKALIRGGFEPTKRHPRWQLRLGGDKPGVVYNVWFPHGYRWNCFVRINKGAVAASKANSGVDWDFNRIILKFV